MSSATKPDNLYEYAIIRLVPDVEREEFINVGLVMMCKRRGWLRQRINVDIRRLSALCPDFEPKPAIRQLQAFADVAEGVSACSPIAQLEAHERFRWLTAVRSTIIQTSRPHPGLCEDLDKTFEHLYNTYV